MFVSKAQNDPLDGIDFRSRSLYELRPYERWWRDRQASLEARGYLLRRRFRPGWEPSWLLKNAKEKNPIRCEDSLSLPHTKTIDATRLSDGRTVFIKRVHSMSPEVPIVQFLSSPEKLQDPRNHCVPILDVFRDEEEPNISYLVMPLLHTFDDPPFYSVDEVIDFMRQTLEGLSFMHANGVAHRDCASPNIMMDADAMYPLGFHPTHQYRKPSGSGLARFCQRRDIPAGVRYYFIDFGISTRFQDCTGSQLVTGRVCQEDVPELSDEVPYDPFAVDIFLLGSVYKKLFIDKYTNLVFLEPLVNSMTQMTAASRPSVDEALSQLEKILEKQDSKALRWRLKEPGVGRIASFLLDVPFLWQELTLHLRERLHKAHFW